MPSCFSVHVTGSSDISMGQSRGATASQPHFVHLSMCFGYVYPTLVPFTFLLFGSNEHASGTNMGTVSGLEGSRSPSCGTLPHVIAARKCDGDLDASSHGEPNTHCGHSHDSVFLSLLRKPSHASSLQRKPKQ